MKGGSVTVGMSGEGPEIGRVPAAPGSHPSGHAASGVDGAPRVDPSRDDDPYWEYDESGCGNCGGEGFVYGCSWDWQCDTYDEGEGTCLCTRPCDWCSPRKPDPELQRILSDALLRDSDRSGEAIAPATEIDGATEGESAGPKGIAQPHSDFCGWIEEVDHNGEADRP